MKDDVRKYIYGTLIVFVVGLLAWFSFLFVSACGFTFSCNRGDLPIERTPIPTLHPALMPTSQMAVVEFKDSNQCRVQAVELIGAWVEAGAPQEETFSFTDEGGQNCESTYQTIEPLFVGANLWYSGSLSCVSCHSTNLTISPGQLDLGSYDAIIAGSGRSETIPKGTDILGGGKWRNSLLYEYISEHKPDIPGHDQQNIGLMVVAGRSIPMSESSPASGPPEEPTNTPIP